MCGLLSLLKVIFDSSGTLTSHCTICLFFSWNMREVGLILQFSLIFPSVWHFLLYSFIPHLNLPSIDQLEVKLTDPEFDWLYQQQNLTDFQNRLTDLNESQKLTISKNKEVSQLYKNVCLLVYLRCLLMTIKNWLMEYHERNNMDSQYWLN